MPPIPSEVVAADITPDGRQIALKIRREGVRLYPRGPGQSVAQALAGPFCTGPGAAGRDRSVALDPAGWGYTLVSDGLSPAISAIRVHAQCPEFDDIEVTGKLRADRAIEVSGLAASRRQPGVLWAHNDGGSGPRTELMAFDQDGTHRGDFVLSGAKNRDWEDLALGAGPDSSRDYLYIGDIGDNGLDRTKVFILRVPEPSVGEATDAEQAIVEFEEFELHYDDGDSHNAESMAVDPLTDAIYVVTKHSMDDAKTEVYMAAAPLLADQTNLLRRVLSQDDAKGLDERFTAADISSGGELFVLKVDDGPNLLWPRQRGEAIFELLQWPACKLPSPGGHHESIAFGPGGDEYFMVPEGKKPEVFRVSASD